MSDVVNIKFAKVRGDAKLPTKRREDAGYDIYACFDEQAVIIPPNSSKLIPTGIASALPVDWAFIFYERGSTGVRNMKVNAGVIDSGFRGEWFVCLYNGNNCPIAIVKGIPDVIATDEVILYPYTKGIAQALLIQVPETNESILDYSDLQSISSERGTGQLGASGK